MTTVGTNKSMAGNGTLRYANIGEEVNRPIMKFFDTNQIRNHLSSKLSLLTDMVRKSYPELAGIKNIPLDIRPVPLSKSFAPINVMTTNLVLKDQFDALVNKTRLPSFLQPDDDEDMERKFIDEVQGFFGMYVYTDEEIDELYQYTKDVAKLGIDKETARVVAVSARPRLCTSSDNHNRVIPRCTILIDPVKVFIELMERTDSRLKYDVFIENCEKRKKGSYVYTVSSRVSYDDNSAGSGFDRSSLAEQNTRYVQQTFKTGHFKHDK